MQRREVQATDEPVERRKVQEPRHQPSDRTGELPRGEVVNRPHHQALLKEAMNDRTRATNNPSYN